MTSHAKPAVGAVIYDMDGVLLDTEPFYTEAARAICERYGRPFDPAIKSQLLGRLALDSARILIAATGLPLTPVDYLEERRALLDVLFPGAEAMPGARALTHRLAAAGIPQAVATSSDRRTFELKTTRHRTWFQLFDCIVLGDDPAVVRGKPAADIFLTAAARIGAEPRRCLVIEDAPAGVEAARAAGMAVVAIADPMLDSTLLADADEILPDLTLFEPVSWGLPDDGARGTTPA